MDTVILSNDAKISNIKFVVKPKVCSPKVEDAPKVKTDLKSPVANQNSNANVKTREVLLKTGCSQTPLDIRGQGDSKIISQFQRQFSDQIGDITVASKSEHGDVKESPAVNSMCASASAPYHTLKGVNILELMKTKVAQTFIPQPVKIETEDPKASLVPGTDVEYRTPGAHYKNKHGKIKRPMNAFMVWARDVRGHLAASMPNATNSEISVRLGQIWAAMPPEQKQQYYDIAERIKAKHRKDYPDWVYKPCVPSQKKKDETVSVVYTKTPSPPVFFASPLSTLSKIAVVRAPSDNGTTPYLQSTSSVISLCDPSQVITVPAVSGKTEILRPANEERQSIKVSLSHPCVTVTRTGVNIARGTAETVVPVSNTISNITRGLLANKLSTGGMQNSTVIKTTPPCAPNVFQGARIITGVGAVNPPQNTSGVSSISTFHIRNPATPQAPAVQFRALPSVQHPRIMGIVSPRPRGMIMPRLQFLTPTTRLQVTTPATRLQVTTPIPRLQVTTPTPRLQVTTPTPRLQATTPTPRLQVIPSSTLQGILSPCLLSPTHSVENLRFLGIRPILAKDLHPGPQQFSPQVSASPGIFTRGPLGIPIVETHISPITSRVRPVVRQPSTAKVESTATSSKEIQESAQTHKSSAGSGLSQSETLLKPPDEDLFQSVSCVKSVSDAVENENVTLWPFPFSENPAEWSDKPAPLYVELFDPYDPFLSGDTILSEMFPGSIRLDMDRWKQYLEEDTEESETDPFKSLRQQTTDETADDILPSPLPLKQTLSRLLNAHVQSSDNGDVVTGDLVTEVAGADEETNETDGFKNAQLLTDQMAVELTSVLREKYTEKSLLKIDKTITTGSEQEK